MPLNKNVNVSFANVPHVNAPRTMFGIKSEHKTTFNAGDLIPIYVQEVLPGDSVKMITSKVIRAQTLIAPIMDSMYADISWWFVPNRLTFDHWKNLCGENTNSPWVDETEYQVPSIASPEGGFEPGTIADYMGLPVNVTWSNSDPQRPSALPFRAYAMICNEFWRSEVVSDPLNIPTGDANQQGSNGDNYIDDVVNGGKPFKAARFFDLFSSSVPSPQKGKAVEFKFNPLISINGLAPVGVTNMYHDPQLVAEQKYGLALQNMNTGTLHDITIAGSSYNTNTVTKDADTGEISGWYSATNTPANLYAKLDDVITINNSGVSFTINELRLATQLQKFYEKQALGSRYVEVLKIHFGVDGGDARLQRPEYLGGNRIPLAVSEVANTAQTDTDFLGDVGAKSQTSDVHYDFEKGFLEHGYLIGLCCVRYTASYSQGLERFWTRRKFEDFYWPVFQSLGYFPVYDSEIYADSTTMSSGSVFAYNEAWYDYRYKPNRLSGLMRPQVSGSLAHWHLGDNYSECPTLSDSWMRVDKSNVDRVLAVSSSLAPQFFADFYFDSTWTRTVPMYSIPGLLDHF